VSTRGGLISVFEKRLSPERTAYPLAGSGILTKTITNKRLAEAGYFEIQSYYESLHVCG